MARVRAARPCRAGDEAPLFGDSLFLLSRQADAAFAHVARNLIDIDRRAFGMRARIVGPRAEPAGVRAELATGRVVIVDEALKVRRVFGADRELLAIRRRDGREALPANTGASRRIGVVTLADERSLTGHPAAGRSTSRRIACARARAGPDIAA